MKCLALERFEFACLNCNMIRKFQKNITDVLEVKPRPNLATLLGNMEVM